MTQTKHNCWEWSKCGREPGGAKVRELGVCPTAKEARLDGVHDGKNAGRACWMVAGTMCDGEVQGTFAVKYKNCSQCEFYRSVREQEGGGFVLSASLIRLLR